MSILATMFQARHWRSVTGWGIHNFFLVGGTKTSLEFEREDRHIRKNHREIFAKLFSNDCQKKFSNSALCSSVRRIFERGAGNLKIRKTKTKISPLKISPFSCPKLGEDQKKNLHSKLVRFLGQN